jgi:hypothetical protein
MHQLRQAIKELFAGATSKQVVSNALLEKNLN